MNLNAITLAITRPGSVRSWDPLAMFTGTTTGVWYDPSDMTTLYQDSAGTTPVTAVEQPVGLMLDKSKGLALGPELVTNGDFSNGTTGWTLIKNDAGGTETAAVVSGAVQIIFPNTSPSTYCQLTSTAFSTVIGKTYRVSASIPTYSGATPSFIGVRKSDSTLPGSNMVNVWGGDGGVFTGNGVIYFTATSTTTYILLQVNRPSSGQLSVTFDNISVRELPGNHAFQSTSANRPTLSARYNLLTKSEDFSDAVWAKTNSTTTATSLTESATSSVHVIAQSVTYVATDYTFTVEFKPNGRTWIAIQARDAVSYFNLAGSGALGNTIGAVVNRSIVLLDDGYYRCSLTVTATAGANDVTIYLSSANGTVSYTGDGVSGVLLRRADLRVANDALNQPSYQRVNTSTDYDVVGFKPYLRFNGTSSSMQTNSIDFTYGDKMFVSAGVRNLVDGVPGTIAETSTVSNNNPGTFAVFATGITDPYRRYGAIVRGGNPHLYAETPQSFTAPTTNVVAGIFNTGSTTNTEQLKLRVNGVPQNLSYYNSTSTGNYGNYPLYLGARAGTSLFFNGRLYGMVVAGKQASDAEIASTETYLNQRTGAF